jgi:hypothetical protein
MEPEAMSGSGLDRLIPVPGLLEEEHVDLAVPPEAVWERVRRGDLARSPFVQALFTLRTLPDRLRGKESGPASLRLDDLVSTPERPGFGILVEDPPREVCVGAIGRVWEPDIPFVHVADANAFHAFDEPGYAKVAWALQVAPRGGDGARLTLELRVAGTDEKAWGRFRRYFHLIGPGSRFIRRSAFRGLARELGRPRDREPERALPGDELLPDAAGQLTHAIDIQAPPETIWPWLVQMGCGRAGFYSIDWLDNAGVRSAREIHPELQDVAVGDVLPASPGSDEGFEVLRLEPPSVLVLGGLFDRGAGRQLPFEGPRPERYWHVTWTFVLERLDGSTTRLHVRARGAFPSRERLHATWIRPVHHLMERTQLRNLKARAEGHLRRDDLRDVVAGAGGAALMVAALLTPFLRGRRKRWGLDRDAAERRLPGDDLVEEPRWSWTHAIEIDAPGEAVWPWVAQIGADRGGFYSHQWLENLAGVDVRNAERVHPEWQAAEGDGLLLHPQMPPLPIVRLEPGRFMVAYGGPEAGAREEGRPWVAVSWLFLVEPLGEGRSRLVSRFRAASSDDMVTRLSFGPTVVEPVGFVMDRQMLRGIKERAERKRGRRAARRAESSPR